MIYYNSRYLSERLGVNLARWKRWSRTFLSADPLGGLQSGVARQFNLKDSFKVYLGGYLVGHIKFSIPDAVRILRDLSPWLKQRGFFQLTPKGPSGSQQYGQHHHIYIHAPPAQGEKFAYTIRSVTSSQLVDDERGEWQETFVQSTIGPSTGDIFDGGAASAHLLGITALYRDFLNRLT